MDATRSIPSVVGAASFSFLTTKDIRNMSVKAIVNPVLLDNTNAPTAGGLYDPSLGPMKKDDICQTCHLNSFQCPGHFGHIELPSPVYHPLFMLHMYNLLRGSCLFCHRFKVTEFQLTLFIARLRLLDYGLVREAEELLGEHLQNRTSFLGGDETGTTTKRGAPVSSLPEPGDGDGELHLRSEDDRPPETVPEFKKRINSHVDALVAKAIRTGEAKGADKGSAAYAARKAVVSEFMKSVLRRKCERCHAVSPTLRKDGHLKIMERDLSEREKAIHAAMNLRRPDAITEATRLYAARSGPRNGVASGSSASNGHDSDEEGSQAESDNAMDVEEGHAERELRAAKKESKEVSLSWRTMPAVECRAHLRLLFDKEQTLCDLIFGSRASSDPSSSTSTASASPDVFFMDVIAVSPTRFRPASVMGETTFENPLNELLTKVIQTSYRVRDFNKKLASFSAKKELEGITEYSSRDEIAAAQALQTRGRTQAYELLLQSLIQLQVDVNSFVDSTKNPTQMAQGRLPPPGVKQALEKKEGLFRKHMMGKRVNYAARSVISPDVNIETNEIGVPPVFARKLTFPEPVTEHNVQRMRQLVINGPDIWPGAVAVRSEDGTETLLAKRTLEERTALANQLLTPQGHNSRQSRGIFGGLGGSTLTPTVNKTVLRHLDNGDVLLLNRQPTLHKPSMMAHKARVLRGEKTIRMHYANCNSYNADFDGDEMNMHFPQSQAARSECYHIANTDNQYLVPTSGNPLRGLIQDHVVAGVWMTCKDSIFTREQYQQLLYGALRPEENYTGHGRVLTLPPAIWRPKPLWTGKQIISTVLLNLKPAHGEGLNMTSKAKVAGRFWGADHASEEQVVFEDGELLCGVLDKSQFGASAYGLVHAVFEIYGPEYAGKLLSILSRLFTKFLQHRAFTCRMDDLMLSEKGDKTRRRLLKEGASEGRKAALKCVGLGDRDPDDLDTDRNLRLRLEEVLREDDKLAALDADMMSSANELTSSVIDSCIPDGLRKRFPHNHMQMMTVSGAKGSPVNVSQISCLLGSQALEGRRVPVMVSGKTLPSFKPFDTSAGAGGFVAGRFLTGLKPHEYYFHCMAGREGLIDTAVKTSRSGYLQRCLIKHLEGITVHYDHTVRNSDGSVLQFHYGEDALDVTKSKYLDQFDFTALNFESFVKRYEPGKLVGVIEAEEAAAHMRKALKKPNKYPPVLSAYSPARHFGATSERFAMDVQKYMDQNPRRLLADSSKRKKKKRKEEAGSELVGGEEVPSAPREPLLRSAKSKIAPEQFRAMSQVLYQRGLVEPGESVGLLAAQGVGEPSTQMTLNTFHFAGHGAANVTLGIPRLREIVMTASQKIKTPIMRLPLREGVSAEQAAKFCKQGSRLLLGQLVDHATVTERVSGKTAENGYERRKTYVVRLQFFPAEEYREEYATTPAEVLGCVEADFVHVLEKEIIKEQKRLGRDRNQQAKALGQGQRARDGPGAAGDAEDGEGGVALEDEAVAREVAPSKGSRSKTSTAATSGGRPAAAEDQSDSDDDDALQDIETGDGDADDAKRKERSAAKASYDADSDSDSDSEDDAEDEEAGFEAAFAKAGKPKRSRAADVAGDDEKLALAVEHARENLRTSTKFVQDLQFDVKKGEWVEITLELLTNAEKMLLISVVERACRMSVVNEIPKITRILATPAKGNEKPALTAEGINFRNLWYLAADIVDLDGIYTNDIGALLHTYGVEAARAAIVSEMAGIFKTYGIGVSLRHLYLIADYQTASGAFRPFSRGGIADAASPMLKASFEMTMSFLANAALHGERDNLDGPSANLVVGRPVHSGTGAVGVHVQLPMANVVAA